MKKYINKIPLLLFAVIGLSSCLKDDTAILDPAKGHNVIEFSNPTDIVVHGSSIPLYAFSYESVPSVNLPITVSYSGPEAAAPQDITVKFGVSDDAKIAAYNTEQKTSLTAFAQNAYSLPTTEVVIKKGTSKATFNVVLKPENFDFSKTEVLGLTISSVSSGILSGNFATILINASAKNKYDGIYAVTGTMVDVTAASLTHVNNALGTKAPMQYELRTVSATKCAVYDNYVYGGYYAVIASGTATSQYGSFSAIFEFDPVTNKVIGVTNRAGEPASNTRSGRLDPTGDNTALTNGVFKVKYNMLQPSVIATAPYVRTTWDETWTLLKKR
ncbi:DUF1735 domain-containing protein [Pedobacter sp. Hv1]|uniref:DUF1735 domain-containing protein n=1 Tax=Pedobacter sp. Hv1 TaxID=1740090 RepID=UPI0006D8BD8C|nr:DUF1735 domain-containing protein [Pedobacter sp. Hv1]KQC01163.1 hypothetical protein AQF98_10905 [Pedobacter sp. Hv1]